MAEPKAKIRVLLEMRPALEGFAGIPQEVRLLFRWLYTLETLEIEGMIQTSHRILAQGTMDRGFMWKRLSQSRRINRYSRVIVSMAETPYRNLVDEVFDFIEKKLSTVKLLLSTLLGMGHVKLTRFESKSFEDFTWQTMFSKTLPAADFALVAGANHRICFTPWNIMHTVGLNSLAFVRTPRYPRLNTRDFDVFIAQTPFPGRVRKGTALVVRYHDAIPIFMPHTISDKSIHQASHFFALMDNVSSGAWFACVSDATRNDLIRMFPAAAARAVRIHNMVSHHYFEEQVPFQRVPGIIRTRLYGNDLDAQDFRLMPKFLTLREQESFFRQHLPERQFKYLLAVSTIEPRKNHARLLAAWEVIRADIDPDIKLVVVGTLGWDYKQVYKSFRSWIDRGQLFMLNAVPAPDLRVLYHHAAATVCPSLGEGFDFSGVEAMRCGGIAVASNIAVHQEVYDDAAEFFDPYSTMSLVNALRKVLYDPDSSQRQATMRERGREVSARYLPERILPQWQAFLDRVTGAR